MKKILMALTIAGVTYFSAEAQTDSKKNCEVIQNQVCSKGHSCYPTKYAENFKVCKGGKGYFICCEAPNKDNSTHPAYAISAPNYNPSYEQNEYYNNNETVAPTTSSAPQSQSYTNQGIITNSTYMGYYQKNGKLRACYTGNNVAEENRAPYNGCPSPQYDGPDLNKERNVNIVTQ